MPSLDHLLTQLEGSKRQFGADGKRTVRLLTQLGRRRFRDIDSLIRFHEALLFVRSHPQSSSAFRQSEKLLSTFARRVEFLRSTGIDLTPADYIEYSGIAGTTISGTFSYDIVCFLVEQFPARVDADWSSQQPERMGSTLPRFLPLLYEDSLVEANIPYLNWLRAATGRGHRELEWLVRRFDGLKLCHRQKGELYDSLGLRVRWNLGDSKASRTLNKRAVRKPFYHTGPLIRRSEASLDAEFQSPALELQKLSRSRGKAIQDMLRQATTVRYRELYGITHGDPDTVVRADVGRGIEIFLWELPLERRLPLRAYHAGFTLKNGVPINYIEGITICERMEIGFNTFYTFRDGESAWVYSKALRLLHQIVGVTCISIDPYQIGFNNEEAIESGAFWFYRKLGFRPTRPELARLMAKEEQKIADNPHYRTPARVLRLLSAGNIVYEAPGSPRGDWDRFAIRNIGLALQHRMASDFGGDANAIRKDSRKRIARVLNMKPERLNDLDLRVFDDLATMLALIPDLHRWPERDKKRAAEIVRAKMGAAESRYAKLLQRHAKLRGAIIELGKPDASRV
jgi:hypothetical protein